MSDKDIKDFALVIPLTQGKVAIVDLEDYDRLSQFKWHAFKGRSGWYARRGLNDRTWEWMHRFLAGAVKGQKVDHQNGDGLDNRRDNLRFTTNTLNNANRSRSKRTAFPYKGVRIISRAKPTTPRPWGAYIRNEGKKIYLGTYRTAEDAARAYDEKARELFGEFACVNFPQNKERQA